MLVYVTVSCCSTDGEHATHAIMHTRLCFYFALSLCTVSMHLTRCDLMSFFSFVFLISYFGAANANKDVCISYNMHFLQLSFAKKSG